MENRKIEQYVRVIGFTQGEGIILLINKGNNTPTSRCVSYSFDQNEVYEIDQVAKATTFNAFTEANEKQNENFITLLNRNLNNSQIDQINNYLKDEQE